MLGFDWALTIPLLFSAAPNATPAGELDFTGPADPAYSAYECVTGGEEEEEEEEPFPDTFCLALCEGLGEYRATHSRPVRPLDKGDDWCVSRARTYCHNYDLDFEDWCWGERA